MKNGDFATFYRDILAAAVAHPMGVVVPPAFRSSGHRRRWGGVVGNLVKLGLLERLARGTYAITPAGRAALSTPGDLSEEAMGMRR